MHSLKGLRVKPKYIYGNYTFSSKNTIKAIHTTKIQVQQNLKPYTLHVQQKKGRYKHWTGLLEWTTGLIYFWFLHILWLVKLIFHWVRELIAHN